MAMHRQTLPFQMQAKKARELDKIIATSNLFLKSSNIAVYYAHQGEIDPRWIVKRAWSMGKRCYLPVLHPTKTRWLLFVEYHPDESLIKNRFGILEPTLQGKTILPAWSLDLVLVPVVAFDKAIHRLGMGLGYYDTTFAFLKESQQLSNQANAAVPALMGLAYEFQYVPALPVDSWDVPLAEIVTEQRILSRDNLHHFRGL